ncbi:TPA: hypothetical protein N0F65_007298 [Lagenidium giganteum]|uniref:Uncharacterized protein n=1 Tax=Lagenidium giganteum TaxID=4803 RepID=A0AAV2Z4S6_9STRA|nr:TPA: hypothetical protein N0F65_007298 [Lagenidium giganteum]
MAPKLRHVGRGLDAPAGTILQEVAAIWRFQEFLVQADVDYPHLDGLNKAMIDGKRQNKCLYSVLMDFSIYLQTRKSTRSRSPDGNLSRATAVVLFTGTKCVERALPSRITLGNSLATTD